MSASEPLVGDGAAGEAANAPPLRDAVLSGRYFSRRATGAAETLAAFLGGDCNRPMACWFGAGASARDPDRLREALDRDIAAIDALISAQLDAVLHHRRLQRLEGSWRGLAWLIDGGEPGSRVKIKVCSVRWDEICRDLERAPEFDSSQLFHKIYEDEFGMPGGEPFGMLVIDHEVRHRPGPDAVTDDVGALKSLAGVAAAAFAPTVVNAAPALLGVDHFGDLAGVNDPVAPLGNAGHARWRGLSGLEDARFLAVALPRMLARAPWEDDPDRHDGFRYEEYAPDAASRVWMGAGYALAAVAVRAFARFGWPADIRGVETDREAAGLVSAMPLEPYRTDPGSTWLRHPFEIQLTHPQAQALIDAGLLPLVPLPFGPDGVLCAVPGLQLPAKFQGPAAEAADANARISSQLNAMLCVARFAHCVKMIGRDMLGSFRTQDEIERKLQAWLTGYVNANAAAGSETRARFPLVAGQVTVRERPGRPGVFGCIVHLQPHYQLDNVMATFRLTTEIAAPGQRM